MIVSLTNNKGFKWFHDRHIYVKGYAFTKTGTLLKDQSFINIFKNINEVGVFQDILKNLNGSFAVVGEVNGIGFAATDHLRSIPLFYSVNNDSINIYDKVTRRNNEPLSKESIQEFILSGYVIGNKTLLPGINQLTAGQYLFHRKNILDIDRYFIHTHGPYLNLPESTYFEQLTNISKNIFHRLINSAENRTIVIPLSGGYDSRYIVVMLKKLGYKKVICFTYGREDSIEVKIARKVARKLDLTWHFIEYTDSVWEEFYTSENTKKFFDYTFNYASCPHIQEFMAIQNLIKERKIPTDSIVVPGFCGDLLGGSVIPKNSRYEFRRKKLINRGLKKHILISQFSLGNKCDRQGKENILTQIGMVTQKIGRLNKSDFENFISINEAFFTEGKVSKFVINSVRVYEYFGLEWRMPLWDLELIKFWYQVPYTERIGDKLYNRFLFDRVFRDLSVEFQQIKATSFRIIISDIIKNDLPPFFLQLLTPMLKRYTKKERDINAFLPYYNMLYSDLAKKGFTPSRTNLINQILCLWMIECFSKGNSNSTKKISN